MLQNKFERPLDLEISPSVISFYLKLIIIILPVISVVFYTGLSVPVIMLLLAVWVVYLVLIARQISSRCILNLYLDKDDKISLRLKNNQVVGAELHGESIVTSFLIYLNLRSDEQPGKRYNLLLFNDSGDPGLIRLLRVRLRFKFSKVKKKQLA